MRLGLERYNTTDNTLAKNMSPLLIFIMVFSYQDERGKPKRTTFVAVSLRNDKTGWGTNAVLDMIQLDITDVLK